MNFAYFPIGPFIFSTGGVVFLIGVVLCTWMLTRTVHEKGLSLQFLQKRLIPLAAVSFLLGRAGEMSKFWSYFQTEVSGESIWTQAFLFVKKFLLFWHGGLDPFWTAIGFLGTFFLFAIHRGEKLWKWMDAFVLPTILLLMFWNLGAFFGGWDYGKPVDEGFFFAVTYNMLEVRYSVPLHPVQLYFFVAFSVLLFWGIKWWRSTVPHKDGSFFGLMTFFVFLINGFLEYFRGDPVPMTEIFGWEIRMSQLISFLFALGLGFFLIFHTHPEVLHPRRRRNLRAQAREDEATDDVSKEAVSDSEE